MLNPTSRRPVNRRVSSGAISWNRGRAGQVADGDPVYGGRIGGDRLRVGVDQGLPGVLDGQVVVEVDDGDLDDPRPGGGDMGCLGVDHGDIIGSSPSG